MRAVDMTRPQHLNCVRYNIHNTPQHELMKAHFCWLLRQEEHQFISECEFYNGKRGDVVDLDELIIYEICASETERQCVRKTTTYPRDFEIRIIDANGTDFAIVDPDIIH